MAGRYEDSNEHSLITERLSASERGSYSIEVALVESKWTK
jgi:hypothetical protein